MADAEEPQFNSLKERIAALNQKQQFNPAEPARRPSAPAVPGRPVTKRPPPPPPPAAQKQESFPTPPPRPSRFTTEPPPLPRRDTSSSQVSQEGRPAPPPLPRRDTGTSQASQDSQGSRKVTPSVPGRPLLSARKSTSRLSERRGSTSSDLSQRSTGSTLSQAQTVSSVTSQGSVGRRLPPALGEAKLPPLPPSRKEREAQAAAEAEAAAKNAASKPGLPPRLPSRPGTGNNGVVAESQKSTAIKAANIKGFGSRGTSMAGEPKGINGFSSRGAKATNGRPATTGDEPPPPIPTRMEDLEPPPVPVSSRPSTAQIEAVKSRAVNGDSAGGDCWTCRDWNGPDGVAAQFPRNSLPRNDPIGHLARGLCDPFPSYTDKARAIFTWFHYNIVYDTYSFFNKCVKHMTPEETIFTGKAVCQSYSEVYKSIANRAGLECVSVTGHGKGYGYNPLKAGERAPPPDPTGHAWNAVRIDGGRWKLLDACWGAGYLNSGTNQYEQKFSPHHFTQTNDEFGESHFPKDSKQQYRDDGRIQGWEEYYVGKSVGQPPTMYGNCGKEGILEKSVEPSQHQISVYSGETVRFQFSKICEHWTSEKHGAGKPPLLLLSIHGLDGRKDEMIPIETNGYWHWIDVHAKDLGAPGQSVHVANLETVDGKDARGMSGKEFLSKKGKVGMSWGYVMKWDLV